MKVILIGAGKGGTGKTTATAFLGLALSDKYKVAILDLDVMGPNIPRILGMNCSGGVDSDIDGFYPKKYYNLEVFSPAFLIPPGVACAWSGEKRRELIHELIEKVKWDSPDILLCDSPPGSSDEIIAALKYIPKLDGAIIVTTAKRESVDDASRLVALLKNKVYNIPVLGVIENMGSIIVDGVVLPLLNDGIDVGAELDVETLARIPFKKDIGAEDFKDVAKVVINKLNMNEEGK